MPSPALCSLLSAQALQQVGSGRGHCCGQKAASQYRGRPLGRGVVSPSMHVDSVRAREVGTLGRGDPGPQAAEPISL